MLSARQRWLCRRGMRELDLLIGRYLAQSYAAAPPAEQRAFQRLLELQDDELWHYLGGGPLPEEAELAALIRKLQNLPSSPT